MTSVRSLLRNAARPVIDPVWHRVWGRIERRLAPLETRVSAIEVGQVSAPVGSDPAERAWQQLAPAFLNAVSSVEAFAHALRSTRGELGDLRDSIDREMQAFGQTLQASRAEIGELRDRVDRDAEAVGDALRAARQEIHAARREIGEVRDRTDREPSAPDLTSVWERIEFVRRELMFEQRYGRGGSTASADGVGGAPAARVIDTTKLESMRASPGGIRLNLGCGHIALDGYLNVDRRDLPGVDIIATADDLPFGPNSVSEIASAHFLEHFPEEMLRRNLLPYWHSLLRAGGAFRAVVPDGQAMLSKVASGEMPFADFREVLFGAQDYEGDFHYDLFTPASLTALLQEAGFRDVAVLETGRRNGKCYEFEIAGQRP